MRLPVAVLALAAAGGCGETASDQQRAVSHVAVAESSELVTAVIVDRREGRFGPRKRIEVLPSGRVLEIFPNWRRGPVERFQLDDRRLVKLALALNREEAFPSESPDEPFEASAGRTVYAIRYAGKVAVFSDQSIPRGTQAAADRLFELLSETDARESARAAGPD